MSGGVAYVLDEAGDFPRRCNLQMVALEKLEDADEIELVWKMIQRHQTYTQSALAAKLLANWQQAVPKFVKVMPKDYKRVLAVPEARGGVRPERRASHHGCLRRERPRRGAHWRRVI